MKTIAPVSLLAFALLLAAPAFADNAATSTTVASATTTVTTTETTTVTTASTTVTTVRAVPPPPPPPKKWKDSAEASFVNTNGNTKTQTTSGKDNFSYDFDKTTRLELEGGGLGARSQGQQTAEQYYAGEKLQRKYDDRDYVFEKYRWDKNRFAGVIDRQEISAGVGRDLIQTKTDLLTGEVSPGYLNEERVGAPRESVGTSRVYSRYEHTFTPTSKFSQSVEYIQSLADKRDSRINTETALTTALSAHFSVKTSYVWNRTTEPPPGVHKDDEITSFALIATF